jgi:hypothetical protein
MVKCASSALTADEMRDLVLAADTSCGDLESSDYFGDTYDGLQWHVRILHDTAPQAQDNK